MNSNEDPSQKPSGRLSPDELAGEVAKRLKRGRTERGEHRHRRFDIVTVSRIGMGIGIVLFAVGALFAVAWISRLAGFETPGTVIEETPVFGCPGEPETGVLFSGETVQLVGVSEDGRWYAVRDERGPGDVVYADALQIDPEGDVTQLEVRPCEPRDASAIAVAAVAVSAADDVLSTSNSPLVTIVGGAETTTTGAGSSPPPGRPPRRGSTSPGTTTPTTTTTTKPAPGPSSTSTTVPGSPSTSGPGSSTSSSSTTSSSSSSTAATTSTSTSTTTTTTTTTTTRTIPDESTTTVPEESSTTSL